MTRISSNYFSIIIALVIFLISIGRVFFFYFSSDESLIGVIPDDAFYYIQLAKHRASGGFWTFDGLSPATGFHFLYGYFLVSIFFIVPEINWRSLYLLVGILASSSLGLSAFYCAKTIGKLFDRKLILLSMIPFLSLPMLLQSTAMMESWLVVLFAALTIYLITHSQFMPNVSGLISLFTVGVLGSLARTDYGMLPGMIFCTVLMLQPFRQNTILVRSFTVLLGAVCGVMIVIIQNYILTGHYTQASAQIKFYWSAINGHSFTPIITLLSNILVPVSIGKIGIIIFWIVSFIIFCFAVFRSIINIQNRPVSLSITIFFACSLTLLGYIFFYRHNSAGLQMWYSANLAIPSAVCLTAVFYYVLRNKAFLLAKVITIFFLFLAIYRFQFIPYPHQYGMLQAGLFLKNQSDEYRYGSWNAGIISYFSGKSLINLDGLTNDEIVPYIKSNQLIEYLNLKQIRFLIDYEDMLKRNDLRKRGGYDDPRVEKCIKPLFAVDKNFIPWDSSPLKIFAVDNDCN
jgi:hypothetical protein